MIIYNNENTDFNISNPLQEFTVTLEPDERSTIFFDYRYARVLDCSSENVVLRYGESGGLVKAIAGIGLDVVRPTNRIDIFNQDNVNITITVMLSLGFIDDSRFSATGQVITKTISSEIVSHDNVDLTSSVVEVINGDIERRELIIQNIGSTSCVIGDSSISFSRGLVLGEGESVVLSSVSSLYGACFTGFTTLTVNSNIYRSI